MASPLEEVVVGITKRFGIEFTKYMFGMILEGNVRTDHNGQGSFLKVSVLRGTTSTTPSCGAAVSQETVDLLVKDRLEALEGPLRAQVVQGLLTGCNVHKPNGLVPRDQVERSNFAKHGAFASQQPVSTYPISEVRRLSRGSRRKASPTASMPTDTTPVEMDTGGKCDIGVRCDVLHGVPSTEHMSTQTHHNQVPILGAAATPPNLLDPQGAETSQRIDGDFVDDVSKYLKQNLMDKLLGTEVYVTRRRIEIILICTDVRSFHGEKGVSLRQLSAQTRDRYGLPAERIVLIVQRA